MKPYTWFALSLMTLILFFGVNSALADLTLVAAANFDTDTPGQAPDTSLPGGPSGDSFYPGASTTIGTYTVVASLGDLTNQPFSAERGSGAGSFNFGLRLPTEAYTSESFHLKWRFAPVAGGPYMFVVLRGPNLAIHGSMTLTSSSVLFSSAWGSQNDIHVGSLTMGESTLFEWTLDRVTGVQSLSLNGVVVVDNMVTGYHSPTVDADRLSFEGAFQSPMTVAVDDLEVYAGTGTVPAEARTLGQVKALYR